MNVLQLFKLYQTFSNPLISDRFFKHKQVEEQLEKLTADFKVKQIGISAEQRAIHLVTCGKGPTKIMLWSQMHGDEATGTMALLDLIGFLSTDVDEKLKDLILTQCKLYLIPMVNPDGAERFTRRNAQQLDINRDYRYAVSPEAKILKDIRREIQPQFGFNLHDQDTLWSVGGTGNPATLSFLAPASDVDCSVNDTRESAMLVIADMYGSLNPLLPEHIGLFEESYEPRAFGDNFQHEGTATILIEAGSKIGDPEKQEIRKYFFLAMLSGLESIASKNFNKQQIDHYRSIPPNTKTLFHILLNQVQVNGIEVSVGLNYITYPNPDCNACTQAYFIVDLGDLSSWSAYETYSGKGAAIDGEIRYGETANFDFFQDGAVILSFRDGILQSKR
ncbi:MAG: carboxypeptidase [Pedobacter sp.]|nr:MAG: carboxypeptidase [Pedobacter sp.]